MRILVAYLLLAHGVAFGQAFACQYLESAGLGWESGQWQLRKTPIRQPFFLAIESGDLNADSVAKLLRSHPKDIRCERHPVSGWFSCHNQLASFLFFNPKESQGGVSEIRGSGLPPASRGAHPMTVAPFTCQQM